MSRKGKIKPEIKLQKVLECLEGKISKSEAAKQLGVDFDSVRRWISIYQTEGSYGLLEQKQNRVYREETKLKAVTDYLSGVGSLREICEKYKIRSNTQLRSWIKVYNNGKDFKHKMSGGSRMKNTRKTTQEERIEIAKDCIANGYNYGETALK